MCKNTEYQNIETEAAEAVGKYLHGELLGNLLAVNLRYEYDYVWEESRLSGCDFYLVEDGKLKILHGEGSEYETVIKSYNFYQNVDEVWREGAFARLFERTAEGYVNRLAKIRKTKNVVEVEFRGWKEKIHYDKQQSGDTNEIFILGMLLSAAAEKSFLTPAKLFTRREKDKIVNELPMEALIAPRFSQAFMKEFEGWTEILAGTVMNFLVGRPYMLMLLDERTARVLSLLLSTGFYNWKVGETWKKETWDIDARARYIASKISADELLALCDEFFDLTKIPERAGRFLEFLSKKVGEDLEKTFATPRMEIKVRKAEELAEAIRRPAKIILLPEIFDEFEKGKLGEEEEEALVELAESNPQVFAQYWRVVKRKLAVGNNIAENKEKNMAKLNEKFAKFQGEELFYPFESAAMKKFLDGLGKDADLSKYPPLLLQNAVFCGNDAVREKALTICMNDKRFKETTDFIFHDCFAQGWRGGHEVEAIEMISECYDFEAEGEYRTREMLENLAKTCTRQKEIPALNKLAGKAEDVFEMSGDVRKEYIAQAKQAVKEYAERRKNLRAELAEVWR